MSGLQAVLLAQKNSRTPFVVVLCSAAFNLVFDVFLIVVLSLGLPGAAIATVVTQYLALGAFVYTLSIKGSFVPRFSSTDARDSSNGSRKGSFKPLTAGEQGGTQLVSGMSLDRMHTVILIMGRGNYFPGTPDDSLYLMKLIKLQLSWGKLRRELATRLFD